MRVSPLKTTHTAGSILLGLFIVVSFQAPNVNAVTMNETCQQYAQGYIGDPSDCAGWGFCRGGILYASGKCLNGLLYDMETGMCDSPSRVQCRTTVQNVCNNTPDPSFISDPNNCNAYCYCINGKTDCKRCPTGQVFKSDVSACVWAETYQCPADSICRLVPNNKFVGDPANCGQYMRCVSGVGATTKCSDTTARFNKLTGNCERNFFCNTGTGTASGVTTSLPPNPTICVKNYDTTKAGKQYFYDSTTCFGFFYCDDATKAGTWGKCPMGTHFNPTTQQCVTPYTYSCPLDRCGNVNLKFVNAYDASLTGAKQCTMYTVCNNQVATTFTLPCYNPNYPYYNEFLGGCAKDSPAFVACTTKPAPPTIKT